MKVLELFSGSCSFSNVAKERGHKTFTIDIEAKFKPDLVKDIINLKLSDIPFKPDIIWASPPCTTFSIASCSHYWKNNMPKNDKCINGLMMVYKTICLIRALNPKFWFIENPMGLLRKQNIMKPYYKNTITYCQYGDERMKPTDIWNNLGLLWFGKRCNNNDNCHISAPRGSKTGTQGLKDNYERSKIPKDLCLELIKICEKG